MNNVMLMPEIPKTITVSGYTDPTKMIDRGRCYWDAALTYYRDEYVYYPPTALYYKCKNDNVTSVCTNTTDWLQGSFSSQAFGNTTASVDVFRGLAHAYMLYRVDFATPVNALSVQVSYIENWGHGGPGGGEDHPSGSWWIKINDAQVAAGGYLGNSWVNYGVTTPQLVSSVEVFTQGLGNQGDWHAQANCSLGELGIYIDDDNFAFGII
jgi:hypothetical protein